MIGNAPCTSNQSIENLGSLAALYSDLFFSDMQDIKTITLTKLIISLVQFCNKATSKCYKKFIHSIHLAVIIIPCRIHIIFAIISSASSNSELDKLGWLPQSKSREQFEERVIVWSVKYISNILTYDSLIEGCIAKFQLMKKFSKTLPLATSYIPLTRNRRLTVNKISGLGCLEREITMTRGYSDELYHE